MPLTNDPNWWRQAVVYQIYPRSFADSNGDGVGDIRGVTSRVDYLRELGVDAVWLSPFYPSALADGGYDVDDYRAVDPKLGTLADFDQMVATLHEAGLRVVIDIVPNHTSNRHLWFQQALASAPGSPERDRYIFRDGTGPGGATPPADWESVFGGPAWTQVADGQWYLHSFAKEQPDLNWDNPEVAADFEKTLKFWADRGVDGFRVDVASMLKKDLSADPLPSNAEIHDETLWEPGRHPLWDRDEVLEVYRSWRKLFDHYDPPRVAVAEAGVPADRTHLYAAADGLGQTFNFDLLMANFDAAQFHEIITRNLENARASDSSNTWVLSNHDQVRHATRYGLPPNKPGDNNNEIARAWDLGAGQTIELDAEQGLRRARAAIMLLLALPGSTYLYQGEELGLPQVTGIPEADRQDPAYFNNRGKEVGRDGCRVPLPWEAQAPSFGFGTTISHLPQPKWWGNYAIDVEEKDPSSTLNLYRQALKLRREMQSTESLEWLEIDSGSNQQTDVLGFSRPPTEDGQWVCLTNFGLSPVPLPSVGGFLGRYQVLLASGPLDSATNAPNDGLANGQNDGLLLPGETTVWLLRFCD